MIPQSEGATLTDTQEAYGRADTCSLIEIYSAIRNFYLATDSNNPAINVTATILLQVTTTRSGRIRQNIIGKGMEGLAF